jgi:hypothetical protein
MAGMTTVLTETFSMGNVRKWQLSNHTVAEPHLITQKRQEASTPEAVAKSSLTFLSGTADVNGSALAARDVVDISVRGPANGDSADMTALIATVRDVVNSDEFTDMVTSQAWLKP